MRVKICGITQRDQALAIAELGADCLGVNFWPKSKRYISIDRAAGWMKEVPASAELVGVFVNPEPGYVLEVASAGGLAWVQLHGDETPQFCADLAAKGVRVVKAIQVRDEASLESIHAFPVADILLDAYHPQERGGIGEAFPWSLALTFQRHYPERRLWLAGGLTPENIAEAVRGVRPQVVDVASGVESGVPGVKDLDKVARFIQNARAGAAAAASA